MSRKASGISREAGIFDVWWYSDISGDFSLSITEVDFLSEAIHLCGVIVYDTSLRTGQQVQSDEDILDYNRTDYDAIFSEILGLASQLKLLIEKIKDYPVPQYGEINKLAMQIAAGNRFARERLEDAISSGFIGRINAVDRYDPAGFSIFHSYVSLWIQQSIQRYCNPIWIAECRQKRHWDRPNASSRFYMMNKSSANNIA